MNPASRPHDVVVGELLQVDPDLGKEYLRVALDEVGESGGLTTFLTVIRQVAEAKSAQNP